MISQPNPQHLINSSRCSDYKVTLDWITDDAQQRVARHARVSNPKNQHNRDTAVKLLKYLIKHKHWSPFEMCNMCVVVDTTRQISQQILRHRSMHFQEFSQRYADIGMLGNTVIPHLRRQDVKNRQNSLNDFQYEEVSHFYRRISELFEESEHLYQEMVSAGVAKECARGILPVNTRTRISINATIRDWMFYCDVRSHESTQYEHRIIAELVMEIFEREMPDIYEAFFI
jgi:thymidylate synthase (FAD)